MTDKLQEQFDNPDSHVFDPKPIDPEQTYDLHYTDGATGVEVTEKNLDNFDLSEISNIDLEYFLSHLRDKTELNVLRKSFPVFIRLSLEFLNQRYLIDNFTKHGHSGGRSEWHDQLSKKRSPLSQNIKQNSLKLSYLNRLDQSLSTLTTFGLFDLRLNRTFEGLLHTFQQLNDNFLRSLFTKSSMNI